MHFLLKVLSTGWTRGDTRYILGWGGAVRPLIPWPCLRQKSLIFLPCLKQNSDVWYPVKDIRRTYAQAVYRPRTDPLFKLKIDKIDTLFKTKIPKNIPRLAARLHLALIMEYPPREIEKVRTPLIEWFLWFPALLRHISKPLDTNSK